MSAGLPDSDGPRPEAPPMPPDGSWSEVADGIWCINLPVPFTGLRQVNLWLMRDGPGWLMIDCGWASADSRAQIEAAWSDILEGRPITRLLISHFHPDHMGNCRWISERWGLTPLVTRMEWLSAQLGMKLLFIDDIDNQAAFFARHGLTGGHIARYREEFILYDRGVELSDGHFRIRDGDWLTIDGARWQIITGEGHSPELATLYCPERDIYISGDQVLPKISSNIGVPHWEPMAQPLEEFLASLTRIAGKVPASALVLPSHRWPFFDAGTRVRELHEHHDQRLDILCTHFGPGQEFGAGECMEVLFSPKIDGMQVGFAIAEVIAHLNYLATRGKLEMVRHDNGQIRFRSPA